MVCGPAAVRVSYSACGCQQRAGAQCEYACRQCGVKLRGARESLFLNGCTHFRDGCRYFRADRTDQV